MTFLTPRTGLIAPSLLALTLLAPAPAARSQPVTTVATAAVADWDDLEDYYEDLAERREEALEDRREYLEDLAERREEYLEDYYDDLPRAYRRHHAWRPPLAPVPDYGLAAPGYGYGYAPYYPPTPFGHPGPGGPLGYGYAPYGYGAIPSYGYGYGAYGFGPRGGIDIPFGFGLGGLRIRW